MKQEAIEKILCMLYPQKTYDEFLIKNEEDLGKQAAIDIINEFVSKMLEKKTIWNISEKSMKVFRIGIMTQNNKGPLKPVELAYTLEIPKSEVETIIKEIKETLENRITQRRTEYLSKKILLDQSISELGLSESAKKILIRINKTTAREIIKIKTTDLDVIRGSELAKQEIIDKIHSLGLIFADEDTRTPLEKLQDEYNALKKRIERYNQELSYINKKRSMALDELEAKAEEIRKEQKNSKSL